MGKLSEPTRTMAIPAHPQHFSARRPPPTPSFTGGRMETQIKVTQRVKDKSELSLGKPEAY